MGKKINFEYGLGLHKSPKDSRDWLMMSFLKEGAPKLPVRFSRRAEVMHILNQGKEGSCAGQAATAMKEYQEKIDHKVFIELSARFIYEEAKKISGHSEGTTLKAICEALQKYGICESRFWKYVPQDKKQLTKEEAEAAYANALKHVIKGYARILNLEELKQSIYEGYPAGGFIMIGVQLYSGAQSEQAIKTGVCPDPTCMDRMNGPIGGHAMSALGWDDVSQYQFAKNKQDGHIEAVGSWGEKILDHGFHFFSYTNIKANMMDARSTVDVDDPDDPNIVKAGYLPKRVRKGLWL